MSLPTIRHALRDASAAFRGAGIPDADTDARRLMAAALGVDPGRMTLMQDDRLTADQAAIFDAYLAMRRKRQPVSQIIGWRDFWKHRFEVTPDTLDPRPETETLVAEALRLPWQSVLDLGTGTGAILISLLAERPGVTGMGVDLSPAAVKVARGNAARLGITADFAVSDWFFGIDGRFDLIVSNPPYIAEADMAALSPEVRDWEPRGALTDEGDGLSAYRAITAGAPLHLTPGGTLIVEIGPTQGALVAALFRAAGFGDVAVGPDLDGRDRIVSGRLPR